MLKRGDDVEFVSASGRSVQGRVIQVLRWKDVVMMAASDEEARLFGLAQKARLGDAWQERYWKAEVDTGNGTESLDCMTPYLHGVWVQERRKIS